MSKKKEKVLLAIRTNPCNIRMVRPSSSVQKPLTFNGADVSGLIERGDKALNENRLSEALKAYKEAQGKNPDELSLYRKLGKTYFNMKEYKSAEENYNKYLSQCGNDAEILIELGNTQRKLGYVEKAIKNYEKAKELEPDNDLANRSILEAKNDLLRIYSPERAKREKEEYAQQNLKEALNITTQYLGSEYMKEISDVTIVFGKTEQMNGTSNIAQYENNKKTITVGDSYVYAAPQVIAAYLVHESVHAKDKDSYTSVREEQDAYCLAAKFWIKNSGKVKDPEMDYAAELYKKSPSALSDRVEEIYVLRDPKISKTSPNHPPKSRQYNTNTKRGKAAVQSLRKYDYIA